MLFDTRNNLKISASSAIACVLVGLLAISFVHSTSAKQFEIEYSKMEQTEKKEVAPGLFGGEGIILTIETASSRIEFDCAAAEIGEKLLVDEHGNFTARGYYVQRGHGPIRVGHEPKKQPAAFAGKISGKMMTLEITLTETEEKIGSYTLERDKVTRLHRCR